MSVKPVCTEIHAGPVDTEMPQRCRNCGAVLTEDQRRAYWKAFKGALFLKLQLLYGFN